jgi:hypothetical protein
LSAVTFQEKWRVALTLLSQARASGFELTAVVGDNEALMMGKALTECAGGQYQSLIDVRRQSGASSNDARTTER